MKEKILVCPNIALITPFRRSSRQSVISTAGHLDSRSSRPSVITSAGHLDRSQTASSFGVAERSLYSFLLLPLPLPLSLPLSLPLRFSSRRDLHFASPTHSAGHLDRSKTASSFGVAERSLYSFFPLLLPLRFSSRRDLQSARTTHPAFAS
jgi:hypothetical protein